MRFEKSPDEVYGMKNNKDMLTGDDIQFKLHLRSHVISQRAQELVKNFEDYQVQQQQHLEEVESRRPARFFTQKKSSIELPSLTQRNNNQSDLLNYRFENERFETERDRSPDQYNPEDKQGSSARLDLHHRQFLQQEEQLSKHDLKEAIHYFFDDLERGVGGRQTKKLVQQKLQDAVSDPVAKENYIKYLDLKVHKCRMEKKMKLKREREKQMKKILENIPYGYQACRFDQMVNQERMAKQIQKKMQR